MMLLEANLGLQKRRASSKLPATACVKIPESIDDGTQCHMAACIWLATDDGICPRTNQIE